jgi:altronate hydrolase
MKQSSFIKINPADSVVVCLRPFKQGEIIEVDGKTITLLQDTPAGHKVLIDNAAEGTNILKYGYPIGHAKKDLKQGEWVNENNLKTNLAGTLEYTYNPVEEILNIENENRTFKGEYEYGACVRVKTDVAKHFACVLVVARKLRAAVFQEIGSFSSIVYEDFVSCWGVL